MKPKQVVTGHDGTGKSVFKHILEPEPVKLASVPGFQNYQLWSTQSGSKVPHEDDLPGVPDYFPAPGGSVFRYFSIAPSKQSAAGKNAGPKGMATEMEEKLPGLLEHLEPDNPGMHTTDSIDYIVILEGEVVLKLDDGEAVELTAGDCVIQNGTRHAWRNYTDKMAWAAAILIGAERKS